MEAELFGQFTLGRRDVPSPPGFVEDPLSDWTLCHHPSLPVRRILDGDAAPVGWLLGQAFDRSGRPAPSVLRTGAARDAEAIADAYTGRFAVALVASAAPQLALDARGSLAVVFDAARQLVGSTTSALDPETPARERKLPTYGFHPGPSTGDPALRRLMSQHSLDLVTWRAVRRSFGPFRDPELDLETRAARIAGCLQHALEGIADTAPITLALSSGYDSRVLLACARPVWDRLELLTFDYGERRSQYVDLAIAKRIGRASGLRHHVLPIEPVSEEDRERYLYRIGYAGNPGKARDFDQACRRHLDLGRALVAGFGVDALSSLYWERKPRTGERGRSPLDLLHLMRLEPTEEHQRVVQAWSETLADWPLEAFYEQLFLEQRSGCWAMPHLYGFAPFAMTVLPSCSREVIDLIQSAPLEQKVEKRMHRAVIRHAHAPLDAFPYKAFDFAGRWRYRFTAPARRWRRMRTAAAQR